MTENEKKKLINKYFTDPEYREDMCLAADQIAKKVREKAIMIGHELALFGMCVLVGSEANLLNSGDFNITKVEKKK